jgi:hypothetical protein
MYYNSRPGYSTSKIETTHSHAKTGGMVRRDGPNHDTFGGKHISDPGVCTSFGRVEEGDKMRIQAYYDTVENEVMNHDGKVEEQMGILRVFIGADDA